MDNSGIPDIYPEAQSEHFETGRLVARRIVAGDVDSLRPILEDPDLAKWFGRGEPLDAQAVVNDAVDRWDAQVDWGFTIRERASQDVVGYAVTSLEQREGGRNGWQTEPTIAIASGSRGQGYAYEAMRGLIGWSFTDLGLPPGITMDEIRAACLPCNTKSIGLLRKLANIGMKDLGEREVTVKRPGPGEQGTIIARIFSMTREDYGREAGGAKPQ